MKKRIAPSAVIAIVMVIAIAGALGACGRGEDEEKLEIRLDRWVVLGENIRLTFTMPMIAADAVATAPVPDITIEPAVRGVFSWVSPTELQFIPEKDALQYGANYQVSIRGAVPLKGEKYKIDSLVIGEFVPRYFEMAGKVADWPVSRGNPGLVNFLGWHTGEIGQGPLLLLYDQPIEPARVEKLIRVIHQDRRLALDVGTPTADQVAFYSPIDTANVVSVRIRNLAPDGETIALQAPHWKENGEVEYKTWDFTVSKRFYWEMGEEGDWRSTREVSDEFAEGDGKQTAAGETGYAFRKTWIIGFNHPVEYGELEASLSLEAAEGTVVNSWLSAADYRSYRYTVETAPGGRFRLRLENLVDHLGNPLEEPLGLDVSAPDLPPELHLPRSPLVVESKGNVIPVKFLNIKQCKVSYQKLASAADYIRLQFSGQNDVQLAAARSKLFKFDPREYAPNVYHQVDIPLETVAPFQVVAIEAVESGSQAARFRSHRLLVHSSDIAITSKVSKNGVFVWVTAIAKPAALKNAAVALYDNFGKTLAQAVTDASGTAFLAADIAPNGKLENTYFVGAVHNKAMGLSELAETELAAGWQFRLPQAAGEERLAAAIFSDRGVYRSGDTVHLKIIADRAAAAPALTVVIKDSRGREVSNGDYPLDDFASAACDYLVKPNAAVGEYTVHVTAGDGTRRASYAFQVEEYRAPNFVVNVNALRDEWTNAERNYGRIKAEYTKGGALKGRAVSWRVYRQRVPFSVKKLPGYVFGLPGEEEFDGNVADGEGTLNDSGELALDFTISSPVTDSLMLYILQGTVTDTDRQTYSGAYSAVIHPGDYYAGVKPPSREIVSSGDDVIVPVVVVDRNGNPVPDVKVTAVLEEIEFHSAVRLAGFNMTQLDAREEYSPVEQLEITSRPAPVQCRFNIPQAGRYRMVFSVTDRAGRIMRTGFPVTVTGEQPTAWPRFDKEQIELVTDRDRYRDGDTARIVTMSPYKKALGLLTVEKDGVIVHTQVFSIANNTPALTVPVKADYAPNVYASVVLVRGREHFEKDASGFETGAPGFKIGYARIDVEPANRRLSLAVKTPGRNFHPGETVTVALECADRLKKPAGGQVTVAVVDEAVLSLTGFRTPDPLTQLLSVAPLGFRTGSNLLDLPHSRRSRHETLFEGGGDDLSGYVEPEKVLRNLFMSTAYWNPNVLLDQSGKGSVTFKLPDNITGYRIMAVVVDKQQRLGSAQERITSKKPLMIMPVLPRFVYPGDQFTAEARLFNETGAAGSVTVKAVLKGVTLVSGKAEITRTVANNGQEFFRFPVKVTDPRRISIQFQAALGKQSDRAEYAVPVQDPLTERKLVKSAVIPPGQTAEIAFDVPATRLPGSLALDVTASATVLGELKDAVGYIMQYPHGCIEQTTSNAYPLIIFREMLPDIGIEVDREKLRTYTEAGIARILTFITNEGGLSYWPESGEGPHPYGTGFGAMALVEARRQGYAVPQEILNRLAGYMEGVLARATVRRQTEDYGTPEADTLALYAAVLGRMGRPQTGFLGALWRNNDKLSSFGLAFLAVAAGESGAARDILNNAISLLRTRIIERGDEAYVADQADGGGYSFSSNIRSHGAALYALSAAGGEERLAGKLLTGLLKRRSGNGFWGNTQETIFGIMGIHRYAASGAGPEAQFELTVNGKAWPVGSFRKYSSRVHELNLDESAIGPAGPKVIGRLQNRGSRPLYLSTRLIHQVKLEATTMGPSGNGFTIERGYETADGRALNARQVPLGELILVRLKVTADAPCHYCAVDDRLPAGFEPLNANLRTTERTGTARLSATALATMERVSYSEIRDARVFFYVNEMPAGEYEFTYFVRTTTAGTFLAPAARVEPMYDPLRFGAGRAEFVTVGK